jgi:hypothetical protein
MRNLKWIKILSKSKILYLIGLYKYNKNNLTQLSTFYVINFIIFITLLEEQGISPTNNHAERTL